MQNEIKLIVSDIDGTLVNDNLELPENFSAILKELENRDIIFVAASGRSTQSIQFTIKDNTSNLYFISNNGAILEHNNEIIYINKFDKQSVETIVKSFRKTKETTIIATSSNASYVELNVKHNQDMFKDFFYNAKIVDDITKVDDDIVKISMFSENLSSQNYKLEEIKALKKNYHLVKAGINFIDIMRADSNKGNALETLLKKLNIHKKNTIGFGDYHNDIHMLEVVGRSYAMEEAHPDVKLVADEVIGSNNDDSVTKKIIELLNLNL